MRHARASAYDTATVRPALFLEVPALVRLIRSAVDARCRTHYDVEQRRAVYLTYAQSLFVDVVGSFRTLVVTESPAGAVLGCAQLDPREGRLRALFVAPEAQGRGLGALLLGAVEAEARRRELPALVGAMALNAVPFYTRAGFVPSGPVTPLATPSIAVPILPMRKPLGSR